MGTIVGDNVLLDARRGLTIGKNVNFSSNVSVYTLQHDHRSPTFSCSPDGGNVAIGDRVWIGCNVVILPGVTIGEGAVLFWLCRHKGRGAIRGCCRYSSKKSQ